MQVLHTLVTCSAALVMARAADATVGHRALECSQLFGWAGQRVAVRQVEAALHSEHRGVTAVERAVGGALKADILAGRGLCMARRT